MQPERDPGVDDSGLCAGDAGALAAARPPAADLRQCRSSGRARQPLRHLSARRGRPRARHRVRPGQSLSRLRYRFERRYVDAAGELRARGLTPYQLSLDIAAELRRRYIKDPKVSVEVETYRPFFILGEVNKPGGYPYVNGMTAEAAVAIAEGYTERAKKRMVRLTRRFGGVNSTVMVPTDYPVQPGDTIYVLERFF